MTMFYRFGYCLVLFAATLTACGPEAQARDGVFKQCVLLFDDNAACQCATERLRKFASDKDYASYSVFGETLAAIASKNSEGRYFQHYSRALEDYAGAVGEEAERLKHTIAQMSGFHREAMQRCGLGNAPQSASKGRNLKSDTGKSKQQELTEDDVHQRAAALHKMCTDAGNGERVCHCAVRDLKAAAGAIAVADFDRLIHGLHENQKKGLQGRDAWDASIALQASRQGKSADEILRAGRLMGEKFEDTTNACGG
ncbi:MAG: hypothetical protein AAF385_02715 [Pseudomonadota bacterium]